MNDYRRIFIAFVKLGEFLRGFSHTDVSEDDWSQKLDGTIALAGHKNGWFTEENVKFALSGWANLLKEDNLSDWLGTYGLEKNIPKNEMGYFNYNNSVPHWNHKYVYSFREIGEANSEQLAFYRVYKNHFLNKKYIDVKGNDNYSFILFFQICRCQV